ncbi:hypothetical protein BS78_07G117000 [Paspalum vaginatum]|nr:hypothetical protein BS78_07G117000 [Paspalum vaginatum]
MTMWAIWHVRRKAIHENSFQSPLLTHSFVDRYMLELEMARPMPVVKQAEKVPVAHWIPPPEGFIKINVDAALAKNISQASVVAIARDAMIGVTDPETMEALACREGLALANDLQLQRIRLASDCINEIKARMKSFTSVEVVHEGRGSKTIYSTFRYPSRYRACRNG